MHKLLIIYMPHSTEHTHLLYRLRYLLVGLREGFSVTRLTLQLERPFGEYHCLEL